MDMLTSNFSLDLFFTSTTSLPSALFFGDIKYESFELALKLLVESYHKQGQGILKFDVTNLQFPHPKRLISSVVKIVDF